MIRPSSDERNHDRRGHRQEAIDATELAAREFDRGEAQNDPDWQEIAYWQRDALIHALLALSAVDS